MGCVGFDSTGNQSNKYVFLIFLCEISDLGLVGLYGILTTVGYLMLVGWLVGFYDISTFVS